MSLLEALPDIMIVPDVRLYNTVPGKQPDFFVFFSHAALQQRCWVYALLQASGKGALVYLSRCDQTRSSRKPGCCEGT